MSTAWFALSAVSATFQMATVILGIVGTATVLFLVRTVSVVQAGPGVAR